jgi:rRNA maturation endonuclease Nob1
VNPHILDASAVFHARDAALLGELGPLYTTSLVIEELRDPRARAVLGILDIHVVDVDPGEVRRARLTYGLGDELSDADVSLIVLALRMRSDDPIIVTDDVSLIRVLRNMGFRCRPIFLRPRKI